MHISPADVTAYATALVGVITAVTALVHAINTRKNVGPLVQAHLTSEPVRASISKMVRSSAKDELQNLTEASGQPFVMPPPAPADPAPSMLPAPTSQEN